MYGASKNDFHKVNRQHYDFKQSAGNPGSQSNRATSAHFAFKLQYKTAALHEDKGISEFSRLLKTRAG